jgi:hypothetical protein
MDSSKIRAVTFIVFIAIVVFFFAYWATASLINPGTNSAPSLNWASENSPEISGRSGNIIEPASSVKFNLVDSASGINVSASSSDNLTKLIANDISAEFVSKAKDSPNQNPSQILEKLDSTDLVQNKLSNILQQSTVDLVEDIPNSELNIVNDSSTEAVKKYSQEYVVAVSRMGGIIASDSGYMTKIMNDAFQNQDYVALDQELSNGAAVIHALESMQVPLPAVEFHKQSLMFLKNMTVFLSSIQTISADPLKAYLMMNKGVSLIQQQGSAAAKAYQNLKTRYNI